ncbi:MAG: hypothetical protein CL681_29385 [Blastopirellula sp.]|nr:hypothetical protein [Blastopirellula sp.]
MTDIPDHGGERRSLLSPMKVEPDSPMHGFVSSVARRQIAETALSEAELAGFLAAACPRPIPPGLNRQLLGNTKILLYIGPMLIVLGLFSPVLFWNALGESLRWISPLTGILPMLFGGTVLVMTVLFRKQKARLLRDGILVSGTVVDLRETDVEVNERPQFEAIVEFEHAGDITQATYKVYGEEAKRGRHLAETRETVQVLVDPLNASQVVVTELLMITE